MAGGVTPPLRRRAGRISVVCLHITDGVGFSTQPTAEGDGGRGDPAPTKAYRKDFSRLFAHYGWSWVSTQPTAEGGMAGGETPPLRRRTGRISVVCLYLTDGVGFQPNLQPESEVMAGGVTPPLRRRTGRISAVCLHIANGSWVSLKVGGHQVKRTLPR